MGLSIAIYRVVWGIAGHNRRPESLKPLHAQTVTEPKQRHPALRVLYQLWMPRLRQLDRGDPTCTSPHFPNLLFLAFCPFCCFFLKQWALCPLN